MRSAPSPLPGLFDAGIPVAVLSDTEAALALAASGVAEAGTGAAMKLMARELPRLLTGWSRTVL